MGDCCSDRKSGIFRKDVHLRLCAFILIQLMTESDSAAETVPEV